MGNVKSHLVLLLVATAFIQSGCATMFTSSKTRTLIETAPPGAVVVAVGGTAGEVIVTIHKGGQVMQKVLGWLSPHLTPSGKAALEKLSFEEFLTSLIAWLNPSIQKITPAAAVVQAEFARMPPAVANRIRSYLGLDQVGVTPATCALKNGSAYAVVAYLPGYQAKVGSLGTRFNKLTLLNVFNGIVPGLFIDLLTGRWRVTTPDQLSLTLKKV